jgi:hypothetical protein
MRAIIYALFEHPRRAAAPAHTTRTGESAQSFMLPDAMTAAKYKS